MIIIGIVYFFGIAAIIYPLIGNLYYMSASHETIRTYNKSVEQMQDSDKQERLAKAREYNEKLACGEIDDGLAHALADENEVMCYVDVPEIGVYIPVFYGTDTDVLNRGCGWVEHTSLPIGGESTHAVISGHTGMPDAEMFTKLDETEIGDVFYIHVLGEVLAYRTDSINIVHPNDTIPLELIDTGDHVTLVTCTPYGVNDKRLLVRGTRIAYAPEEKAGQSSYEGAYEDKSTLDNAAEAQRVDESLQKRINDSLLIIVLIIIAAAAVFVAACVWLGSMMKRANTGSGCEKQQSEDNHGEEKEE